MGAGDYGRLCGEITREMAALSLEALAVEEALNAASLESPAACIRVVQLGEKAKLRMTCTLQVLKKSHSERRWSWQRTPGEAEEAEAARRETRTVAAKRAEAETALGETKAALEETRATLEATEATLETTGAKLADAEAALVGSTVDDDTLAAVAAAASAACNPIDDKRGTIEYRTQVAGVLAKRAAAIAAARAQGQEVDS